VVDVQTNEVYVLIPKHRFDQIRSQLTTQAADDVVAEGIRLSQQALRAICPNCSKTAPSRPMDCISSPRAIGTARDQATLIDQCLKRGLNDDEFYVGWIHPCELIEEEEVERRPQHDAE